ncbi:MAG: EutN/CcmL family microcompartment protein [Ignavibacteriae bacterium]|nr:EutN/CcmL family microcompartment protein [Ignavibacteria bacterium]MBI3364334.1 EutN/CcmL family microcompartment protein [Ignavibacteriota bacterium]
MTLGRVIGTLVATQKNEHLKDRKILIVQPVDLDGKHIGRDVLAIDSADAGVGDTVLVIQEGQGAAQVLGNKKVPVHSVIVAVVDGFEVVE